MSRIPGCTFAWYWRRWSNRTFFIINPDPEMECRVDRFVERWRGAGELECAASSEWRPVSTAAISMGGEYRPQSVRRSGTRESTEQSGAGSVSAAADNSGPEVVFWVDVMHNRVLEMLIRRYDQRIMNNVQRGDYVECMIATALGPDWRLTSEEGWDWAAWDSEHTASETRLEIKQSAARQSWDRGSDTPRRNPGFDIRPRKGYWPKDGGPWVTDPGRPADVYVFAWHGEADELADHRDATQSLGLGGFVGANPPNLFERSRGVRDGVLAMWKVRWWRSYEGTIGGMAVVGPVVSARATVAVGR